MEKKSRTTILDELDRGILSAEEAVDKLEQLADGERLAESPSKIRSYNPPARWESWWLVPFFIGLTLTAAGGLTAGMWGLWLLGGVLGLVGLPLMILGALSQNSAWVYLRLGGKRGPNPRRFAINLPLPLGLAATILRMMGDHIPGLQQSALDELLLALDSFHEKGRPIQLEVFDREGIDRVKIYLG